MMCQFNKIQNYFYVKEIYLLPKMYYITTIYLFYKVTKEKHDTYAFNVNDT